ncbi:hypothetical protein [Neobacillus mesonae]|uniref:DUF1508 domain-containing protein n=1 Tax=Neobacillus mesonae TaxID=1193713 RepID=A0A3Q9QVR8_9BACI|nr:hypothetical protein [Neobacillus mesonae]AZU62578.1 hypothetical protein CHR53_15605 [Neobacillus mesonae]
MLLIKNSQFIKIRYFDYGNYFMAMASTKDCSVWNCYGTTREKAKEMAIFKLNQVLKEEGKKQ